MMGSGAITWPRDAIDALYTQGLIDQSSGIAAFSDSAAGTGTARGYMLDHIAESVAQIATVSDPFEDNLGMAASTPNDPHMLHPDFPVILDRFIKRVTVCPGDFDRNGWVDPGDETAFFAASSAQELYADWNFDGSIDGHLPPDPDRYDEPKFDTGWALGCGGP